MGNESSGSVRVLGSKPLSFLVPPAVAFNAVLNSPVHKLHDLPAKTRVLLATLLGSSLLLVTPKGISRYSAASGEVVGNNDHSVGIAVACNAKDPDLLVIGTECVVELIAPATLGRVAHFDHSPFQVCSVAYLPGGRVLAGLSSGKILQWSLQQQQPVVQYYSEGCTQFLVHSTRHKLVAADHFRAGHSNVVLYHADTGVATQELSQMQGRCLGLCFIDSRNLVMALGNDGLLLGWDVVSGNTLFTLPLSTHLPLNTSFRGLTCLRVHDEDLLLFCTSGGLLCASLHYDYTEMQFTLAIRGKLALSKDTPVVSCTYEETADVLCVVLENTGVELVNLFSQAITNVAVSQGAGGAKLPMFSLQPVNLPPKPNRQKQTDLPLFDLGLPKNSQKVLSQPATAAVKTGPSEDTLQKIRSRVEGKPSARAQGELVASRARAASGAGTPTDSPVRKAEASPKEPVPELESKPIPEIVLKLLPESNQEPTESEPKAIAAESESKPAAEEKPASHTPPEAVVETEKSPETSAEVPAVKSEPVQERSEEVSAQKPAKVETSFQRFLRMKKTELLKENPGMTSKEVIFKVSELWGALTEEEQMQFESNA